MRVIYTWQVKAGYEKKFIQAWEQLTKAIREKRKGAQGSLLMRHQQDPEKFVAIALWETTEDWRAASDEESADIEASRTMHQIATLIRTELFHVIKNLLNRE